MGREASPADLMRLGATPVTGAPASVPGAAPPAEAGGDAITLIYGIVRRTWLASPPAGTDSALPLLVPRVLANHHHTTVPANHLALVADLLDARLNLHRALLSDRSGGLGIDLLVPVDD